MITNSGFSIAIGPNHSNSNVLNYIRIIFLNEISFDYTVQQLQVYAKVGSGKRSCYDNLLMLAMGIFMIQAVT